MDVEYAFDAVIAGGEMAVDDHAPAPQSGIYPEQRTNNDTLIQPLGGDTVCLYDIHVCRVFTFRPAGN